MCTSSMVALSGVTRTLNLEVCTVSREDSRWKADSTSDKCGERRKSCHVTVNVAHIHLTTPYTQLYTRCMLTYVSTCVLFDSPYKQLHGNTDRFDDVECSLVAS